MGERVALLTSGARGLGYATVRALLEAGWDVFFTYHQSDEEAKWLLAEASRLSRRAACVKADLLDKVQVERAVQECLQKFSRVDAFVHNFGPFVFDRLPLAEYSDTMFTRMIEGNLSNFFWIYRNVIKGMRERGFGRIVTIGYDGAAIARGWRYRAPYAAAKAGLATLTRSIAREERQNGITANMVCPGDIRGNAKMQMFRDAKSPAASGERAPVGEDVARVIVFLCSEQSQQLNGTVTEVTGGDDILAHDWMRCT